MIKTYAKISGLTVLKYPYTLSDLELENPHTKFDNRFNLDEWFAQTENAKNGDKVVEVQEQTCSELATDEFFYVQASIPSFFNGNWVLSWVLKEKTKEEKTEEEKEILRLNKLNGTLQ